ncbi:MAG: hypothetical protein M1827_000899 [Pycnora praestabilis]|nr:MAG: hypothetical protein M1827_000899 [Pycnora praestabilis]
MNILRQDILNNVWSKPAYILSLLLRELAKPPGERLEWLLWFDADTVIMNPNIPIELFLPPSPDFDHVHLLVTHDWNGLNNGVFPVRVHPWSVELFAAVLSFPNYSPSYELVFRDQSALEQVLKMPKFGRGRTLKLPQRWFNAYQGKDLKETSEPFEMRRGDLLVHFAGVGERMKRMAMWMERAEQRLPEWEIDLKYSSYPSEVREFWDEKRVEMKALKATVIENSNVAKTLIEHSESELNVGGDRMEDKERKIAEDRVRGLEQVLKTESKKEAWAVDLEGITIATAQLSDATAPLRDILSKIRKETLKDAYTAIFDATQCLIGITSHNSNSDSNTIHHEQQIEEIEDKIERLREKLQSTQEDNLDVKGVTGEVLDLVKAYKDLEIVVQRERFQEAAISAAHIAISGSQGGGNTDEGNGDDGESGGGSESQNGSEDCGGDDQDQDESNHDEENATNNDGSTDDLPSHSSPPLSEKGHPRRSK